MSITSITSKVNNLMFTNKDQNRRSWDEPSHQSERPVYAGKTYRSCADRPFSVFFWIVQSQCRTVHFDLDYQIVNLPKDGTILRKSKTDIIFSGTQVNFDKSMQPYKTWQYGQSSTDLFR